MNAPATARDSLLPQRTKGLGLGAALAILAHVLLILGLAFGVNWRSSEPEGVSAELWAASPQTAAPPLQAPPPVPEPKPAPKPEPTPVPKPPPPKAAPEPDRDADIAIEKAKREREKKRAEEEQERRDAKAKADKAAKAASQALEDQRREQAERDKKEQLAKAQKDKAAKATEAALAQQREENLKRMMGQAGGTGAPGSTGNAQQTAGPSAGYGGRIAARVKPNIVFADDSTPGNPAAEVEVRAAPDGTILGRTLKKSSGVKAWDEAVLRAIDRTEVLPRDTDGRVPSSIVITFRRE